MEERPSDGRSDEVRAAMREVWDRMRETAHARVAAVERAVRALEAGALTEEVRREAEQEAHKMAGSLAIFGVADGSRLARGIEDLLAAPAALSREEVERLAGMVRALRDEVERAG